eukprot:TRINITY_DN43698_c0_g1_i1.p1 TRINITY_DN43698_c0_g1~~TRINITY_DN43698_c0_g1_i1.p1  ORF type:complete len:549 (+),score=31.40 TRINITY_DN43698_c0_g1_i1:84-1730(+)
MSSCRDQSCSARCTEGPWLSSSFDSSHSPLRRLPRNVTFEPRPALPSPVPRGESVDRNVRGPLPTPVARRRPVLQREKCKLGVTQASLTKDREAAAALLCAEILATFEYCDEIDPRASQNDASVSPQRDQPALRIASATVALVKLQGEAAAFARKAAADLSDAALSESLTLGEWVEEQTQIFTVRHSHTMWNDGCAAQEYGGLTCVGATLCGTESESNEDRVAVVPDISRLSPAHLPGGPLVILCDGHGGSECAQWCCTQLPFAFCSALAELAPKSQDTHESVVIREALERAVAKVDQDFTDCARNAGALAVGTCCTAIFVSSDIVYLAHLGDSRAVLASVDPSKEEALEHELDGGDESYGRLRADTLTVDHSADRDEERKEVAARGGHVVHSQGAWRVSGRVQVTRSLGDLTSRPGVSQEPQMIVRQRRSGDTFILCASDGLWSVMTEQEVVTCIEEMLESIDADDYCPDSPRSSRSCRTQRTCRSAISRCSRARRESRFAVPRRLPVNPYEEIAESLADFAQAEKGAGDDISIVIVFLGSLEELQL